MAFVTNHIQIDGSLNVDGSIFQWNELFVGGGSGGGGDVAWASGSVGSNNQVITAAGDGSIVAESALTFDGQILLNEQSNNGDIGLRARNNSDGTSARSFVIADSSGGGSVQLIGYSPNYTGTVWSENRNNTALIYGGTNSDRMLIGCNSTNAPVMIFHGGTKVLETTNTGIDVSNNIQVNAGGALSEKINAGPGLYYFGATAPGDDHGIASYSKTFGGNDYQYIYYRESNDYGGFFHRQGTSYSDLRQDYNYLSWQYGTTGGVDNELFKVSSAAGAVFNEVGLAAADFRIESNSNPYMFFIDAGNNFIGINEITPNCALDASGTIRSTGKDAPGAGSGMELYWDGSPVGNGTGHLLSYSRTLATYQPMQLTSSTVKIFAGTSPVESLTLKGTEVVVNETNIDMDFRVESDVAAYNFFLRGSGGRITMGNAANTDSYSSKPVNIIFNESNATVEASVGTTVTNGGILLRNLSSTNNSYANIDFVADTTYTTTYNAARIAFEGYSGTTESLGNYFSFILYNSGHKEQFRMTRLGNFHAEGDIIAYSTTIGSDIRLKENIETLEENSLDKLLNLRPVLFDWKNRENENKTVGFIAQEFEEYFPSLVVKSTKLNDKSGTEYKHIRYNELIPHITNAMKQQQEIINNQQKEIDELKEKVEMLLMKL